MDWQQSYTLFGHGLAVSAVIAALPILAVLLLLGLFRKPAWIAGVCGLAVSLLTALFCYHMPAALALSAAAYGMAFGLFPICWIVFWAIALFRITSVTGKFAIIRASIGHLTADAPSQALLIAFAFGAFLEGAAGFGTPVAIASAMMVGLGFSPFRAAAICLLANTAPVAFGSIGTPLLTLAATTGLPLLRLSAAVAAICAPVAFIVPAYMVLVLGGWRMLRRALLPCLVTGVVFAGAQFLIATYVGPSLTDIAASVLAMLCPGAAVSLPPRRPDASGMGRGFSRLARYRPACIGGSRAAAARHSRCRARLDAVCLADPLRSAVERRAGAAPACGWHL